MLRKSEIQDLDATKGKQSQSEFSSQNLDIDESVNSKGSPLAESWRDSGYVEEPGNRDSSISQRQNSGSTQPRSHSIIPSALHDISVQQDLRVTSLRNVAKKMQEALADKEFSEELTAIVQWFRVLSEGEQTGALMELIERCTNEQREFIRENILD